MKTLLNSLLLMIAVFTVNTALAQNQEEEFEHAPPNSDNDIGNEDSDFNPEIKIKSFSLVGTGCPPGGTSSVLTPDKKTLSILFAEFRVESLKKGPHREQKQCRLRIEFKVPNGISASITKLDLRGFYSLPNRAQAIVKTEFFLPQTGKFNTGPLVRRKIFEGPRQEDFFISSRIRKAQPKSECGKDFSLNTDLTLKLTNPLGRQEAEATLDTLDLKGNQKVIFHLRWKRCKDNLKFIKN